MRNRVFPRRGEGVAPWHALAVLFAVLALLATSLTFPWTASAEESATTSTSPAHSTTVGTPVNTLEDGGTGTSASAEPSTSATTPAQQRTTTSVRTEPRTTTTRSTPQSEARSQTQQPESRNFQPYVLNPGIGVTIDEIVIERDDPETDPTDPSVPITVGDNVEVHGTWDARNANPEPGHEFSIAFPDELQLTDTLAFDLAGGDGTIWGTCEVSVPDNVMNCVLSDAVENRDQEVHGDFYVYSRAVEYTTAETLNFLVNGETTVEGDLPGDGGIGDGQTIGDATKRGTFTPDRTGIRWTIDVPGTDLTALDEDGTGSVTLSDQLSDNMQLCEDGRLNATLLAGRPGSMREIDGGVTITQEDGAGSPISIGIDTGAAFQEDLPIPPFDPGSSDPGSGGSSTPPGPEGPYRPGDPGEQGEGGGPGDPDDPVKPQKPQKPSQTAPQKPQKPSKPSTVGHDGAPGKPAPKRPGKPDSLAVTGANVAWLGGAALALIAGGAWLTLRNRRDAQVDEVDPVDA